MAIIYNIPTAALSSPIPSNATDSIAAFQILSDVTFDVETTFAQASLSIGLLFSTSDNQKEWWTGILEKLEEQANDAGTVTGNLLLDRAFKDDHPVLYFTANIPSYFTKGGIWRKRFTEDPPLPISYTPPPQPRPFPGTPNRGGTRSVSRTPSRRMDRMPSVSSDRSVAGDRVGSTMGGSEGGAGGTSSIRGRQRASDFLDGAGYEATVGGSPRPRSQSVVVVEDSDHQPTQYSTRDIQDEVDSILAAGARATIVSYENFPRQTRLTVHLIKNFVEMEKGKESKEAFTRRSSDPIRIPYTIQQDILRGNYVNLSKINGFTVHGEKATMPTAVADLLSYVRPTATSVPITTLGEWSYSFGLYADYLGKHFQHLQLPLAEYKLFIEARMRKNPAREHAYIYYDEQFRQALALPTRGLSTWEEVATTPLLAETLMLFPLNQSTHQPSNSIGHSKPSNSLPPSKRQKQTNERKGVGSTREADRSVVCGNWNRGVDDSPCTRRHVCSICFEGHRKDSCTKASTVRADGKIITTSLPSSARR